MEVTGRHAKINLLFEKQIYHNGSINFGLLEFEIHGNAEFEQYIIWYHGSKELIEMGNLHTFWNKQKLCSSVHTYYLSGRIHHFLRKSTLHIDGFSKNEQFDSICLEYAQQPVESVVSHGKYEDNM